MKFTSIFTALVTLASFASGQIQGLPDCAQGCVSIPPQCNSLDFQCICSDRNFITTISCCIAQKCNSEDQGKVIAFAQAICKPEGITDLPTSAVCASTAAQTAAPTGAAAAAGGNSTVGGGTTVTVLTTTMKADGSQARAQAGGLVGLVAGIIAVL